MPDTDAGARGKVSGSGPLPRLSIALWQLGRRGGAQSLARAASLGFKAAQIDFGGQKRGPCLGDRQEKAAVADASKQYGVVIEGMAGNLLNDSGLSAPANSGRGLLARRQVAAVLAAAVDLNIKFVFFPSFREGAISDAIDLRRTARMLRRACRDASIYGITVGSENGLDVIAARALVGLVGEPNFRIVLDTYNPVSFGIPFPSYAASLWACAADQVHVKDARGGGSPGGPSWPGMHSTPFGSGRAGLGRSAAALRSLGFAGALVLEGDYRKGCLKGCLRDMSRIQQHFERELCHAA